MDGGGTIGVVADITNSPIQIGLNEDGVRRVLEQTFDRKLAEISREKGVPEAPLREVLKRLGETEVAEAEIPDRLAKAADELLRLRADLERLRNDRPEFTAIRSRASAAIDRGDLDAARAALNEGRQAARALREEASRTEAQFLADEASIDLPETSPTAQFDGISGFSPDSTAGTHGPDILETDADARALARLMCLEGAAPLAIAVLGGWGSGKSTFMERLDQEVRTTIGARTTATKAANGLENTRIVERVVQVRFNAWQFVDANLWASLTAEFFAQLRAGGWEGQKDASYAGLVERVTRHVHTLNADLEAKRKVASESALRAAEARISRKQAEAEARAAGQRVLEESALEELRALYDSQRTNLSALGLAVAGNDTSESVDAIMAALGTTHSITGQTALIASILLKDKRRLWTVVAIAFGLSAAGLLVFRFGGWSQFVAALSWIGAIGALATYAMPALRFVRSVTRRGAEIASKVEKADREATTKLLKNQIRLKEAEKQSQGLEAEVDNASKRLAIYVDPTSPTNPPRLLRYVLEDDPETQALESQLGFIAKTRRLFQAVDAIAMKEREKLPSERDKSVPDRVILYVDDLDRCSEEQVYNVLQAIHLLLAFELFVVVVGVDITRVQAALAKAAAGLSQTTDSSQLTAQYLDKIFQIAFWLPPLTPNGDNGSYARYVRSLATRPVATKIRDSGARDTTDRGGPRNVVTALRIVVRDIRSWICDDRS